MLACALPILAGYFVFVRDAARRERDHVVQDAQTIARTLADAVDREIAGSEAAARVLANSGMLAHGQAAQIHERMRMLPGPDFSVHAFVMYDASARPILDTRVPFGKVMAPDGSEELVKRVFATGAAVAAGVRQADSGEPAIAILVPVRIQGKVVNVLSVLLPPRQLAELLAGQHLPAQWVAEVYDSEQHLVARSSGLAAARLDARLPTQVARQLAHGQAAIAAPHGAGRQFIAYARSAARRWTVAVIVPPDAAPHLLGHSRGTIAAWVAIMLGLSLGFAWLIGGSIARSVRSLIEPAAALGRGEDAAVPEMSISEAQAVAVALRKVDGKLQRYKRGLASLVAERTAELERSNALLESVYASAPVGLCFMDRELRFVMVNDYLAALNAVAAPAHVGRTLPEVLGKTGEEFEKNYRHVLETGRPLIELEATGEVPGAPGVVKHWISSYYPVFGTEREVVGINAVILDITERKLQEQRNRDNEELFRALFEGSGDAHVLIGYDEGYVRANRAAAALFGYDSVDELLEQSLTSTSPAFQPDGCASHTRMHAHMGRVYASGRAQYEWLHCRRDGTTFHADVVLTNVDIGGTSMVQGMIRDISARVAAETALRATGIRLARGERFIRTVTDHLPGLVGYWDADLHCQFANQPYLDWLGRAEDDVVGQGPDVLLDDAKFGEVARYVEGVLEGRAQSFQRDLVMGSGELIHAWGNYIPDVDERGRVRGFYVLYTDVTELKRTQDRLEHALHEAEQASSAKGRFLANMSHEIRTPMNAIMGLARLLEEAPLGRRERGYVERMQLAAKSLLGMLSDVLDFSKVEAGQLALERRAFRLDEVLDTIAAVAVSNAWSRGVEPVFAVAPDVPQELVGDPVRLGQVLLNLVSNAIKFTERGEVVLSVRLLWQEPGGVRLAFSVRDTGIGIAPEQQEHMFDAFSQADSSIGRKYGGVGLGLAICRRLVDLMGGRLGVQSAPGLGAAFSFDASFPVAAASALPAPPAPATVLVADDNASALAALAEACETFGWQVDRARGGAEALALLRAGRHYDFALLDSAMPDLDGASVMAYACSDQSIRLPRFALLAADPERERLAALAGDLRIGAILAKPFTRGMLHDALAELQTGAAPAPVRSRPALAARLNGLRILLVEDNVINQEVANYALVHAGATVDIAENGRMAVSMLAERTVQYDAVLMDVQMPVMNGYEACVAIRAMGLARLPIIAMTANSTEEDQGRSLAAGMNAHLSKPIEVDVLVDTLLRVLGGARDGVPALAPQGAARAPASIPGIDLKATLPRFGGAFASFAAVFRRLESSQGRTLYEVREKLAAGDRQGAQQLVHRLRGVAANLGATEVATLALEFEQALRSADDAALALRLSRLDSALQVVLDAARELDAAGAATAKPSNPATRAQREDLLALLDLLHNSNLKAMATFDALRPALAGMLDADAEAALADAIGTLRFDAASALLEDILSRKKEV